MTPDGLSDVIACVAALGRSLEEHFDPTRFLAEFSARAQRLVPHDRLLIALRDGGGDTCSIFANYVIRGTALGDSNHYTTAFSRGERVAPAYYVFEEVFEGRTQLIPDMAADSRFTEHPFFAKVIEAGLRARLAVPIYVGGRVTGAFVVASATAGIYTDAHAAACRQITDLIGPFVENVVLLHRERRRRERLKGVTALPPILGASLKVGDVLGRLGEAVRPLIDFDVIFVSVAGETGASFDQIGLVGESGPVISVPATIEESSLADRVSRGELVLIRDAERELDPRRRSDQRVIERGSRSAVSVPLLFGERVGGGLFFGNRRVNWYDETDLEIAAAIANALVLAIQHERLAEQQQRLGAVEAKAKKLERQVQSLRTTLDDRFGFDAIIGRAPNFVAAVQDARKVATTGTTVLLTGESGTGKEVLARAIHHASARADGPFIALNCAALPETLVESELFGHERGAFTGADKLKRGRFELAGGGTLFLDEIGELAPAVQAKLLRVLQDRRYERVGGTTTLEADVRLIAATNRDLERAVAGVRFREDLYYRLAVFRIHLPALRDRGEDVLLLADHFVRQLGAKLGKPEPGLSREARDLLLAHLWPGNIRELQNAIERALILADGGLISAAHLGIMPRPAREAGSAAPTLPARESRSTNVHDLAEEEKQMILEALRQAQGNKSRAAAALGLTRKRFYTRLHRLGLAD